MQLLGSGRLRLWHDQIFAKPARDGAVVAWHQDYSYWARTVPMRHLTVHIALDAQTEDNGVLKYVPGSHEWPLLPVTSRHFGDMTSIRGVLTDDQRDAMDRHVRSARLPAGSAAFHHPLTVHGSFGNRSPEPRRACVVNIVADGVSSAVDAPLLDGLPSLGAGAPLEGALAARGSAACVRRRVACARAAGKFFPLLTDRKAPPPASTSDDEWRAWGALCGK